MFRQEWHQEKIERHLAAASIVPFGVSYLDDALVGIFPNDLILVGARTGRGKTEFATTVALRAAKAKRRVAFFALEADKWEIQRRMKYRALTQMYYELQAAGQGLRMKWPRYSEWLAQGYMAEWDALEQEAEKKLELDTETLRIVYKGEKYTAEDFVGEMEGLGRETDLVIVDHLHYFDLGEGPESIGLKRAIHAVRNASIHHGKPIILLAHLRKGERNSGKHMPDLEDFHGHSDIVKVATNVILMAPVPQDVLNTMGCRDVYPTYFHVAKSRRGSESTAFCGILGFNRTTNSYNERYHVAHSYFQKDPELITDPEAIPQWLKRANRPSRFGVPAA